jgi:hypothetical protein
MEHELADEYGGFCSFPSLHQSSRRHTMIAGVDGQELGANRRDTIESERTGCVEYLRCTFSQSSW